MKKGLILAGSVLMIALAGFQIYRNSLSYKMNHSGMDRNYPMKCAECGNKFTMNTDEMTSCIRHGKAENQPNAYTQFPCPKCGKIASVIYDSKYETADAPK